MNGNRYDVVIIGGGVIGSSIARALSKYQCRTVLLEKEEDVCSGTSKANSAIVHAGYDAKTGSLKAETHSKVNAMMETPGSSMLNVKIKMNDTPNDMTTVALERRIES